MVRKALTNICMYVGSMDRGFGRCLVAKKFATSLRRYSNGAVDRSVGPSGASEFPAGKDDQRFKKQVRSTYIYILPAHYTVSSYELILI